MSVELRTGDRLRRDDGTRFDGVEYLIVDLDVEFALCRSERTHQRVDVPRNIIHTDSQQHRFGFTLLPRSKP